MTLIDQIGTYRGVVLDKGVGVTTNGFPQLVATVQAKQFYDVELNEWVDWEEAELTAYLVLFDGKDKKTLTCEQVEKVFAWGGESFAGLDAIDPSTVQIQFRVVEHTYQEKTSLQIAWIDVYDATPGSGGIRKLDADALKGLDAKYASLMNKTKAKPASAKEAKAPKVPAKTKTKAPPTPPKKAPPTVPTSDKMPKKVSTKQEAWSNCVDLKAKNVTDQQLSQTWLDVIEEVCPGKFDSDITPEEWGAIQETVLNKTAMF